MAGACKNKGRLRIAHRDKQFLWASSGGYCANPTCQRALFAEVNGKQVPFGELAHIISASEGGPRDRASLGLKGRAEVDNVLMLCANCHTVIDKEPQEFPVEDLREWQRNHVRSINAVFAGEVFESRAEARRVAAGLLVQNHSVFDRYGPQTQKTLGRHGPEPLRVWRRKMTEVVIPNNRRLLALLDKNATLLSPDELETLEDFRNHVDDVEARHFRQLAETDSVTFPAALDRILT